LTLRIVWAALAIAVAMTFGGAARANDFVRIGAIYPLSGPFAPIGNDAMAAIETAADIVDTPHPGLEALPLGTGQGLPNFDTLIQVISADHQSNPSVAQSQARRLITQDRVVAMIGGGQSPVTLAMTALTERYRIPFLVPDSTAPTITGRGFKRIFRTTPLATDFASGYARFLAGLKQGGSKVDTIALVFDNTDRGTAMSAALREALKAAGFTVIDIGYQPNATDLSAQVQQLREKNPDAAIFLSNSADAGLFVKTMKNLNYRPPLMIGDDEGFSDPGFIAANGNLAQGLIDRSVWSPGLPGSAAAIVNELYKKKTGRDLDDASARVLQGFLVLADAINRAGSTEPEAIQKALQDTDLRPEQLIVGYNGVRFDETGQNILAATYLTQLQGKTYTAVWPAANAPGKLMLPYKGWE
jgi:branched-chain amino acid transport system substrate-binding protein